MEKNSFVSGVKKTAAVLAIAAVLLPTVSCKTTGINPRVITTVGGALLGTAISAATGGEGKDLALGAGIGAAAGYLAGNEYFDNQEEKLQKALAKREGFVAKVREDGKMVIKGAGGVLFDSGKTDVKPEAMESLRIVANTFDVQDAAKHGLMYKVEIEGHTDADGSEAFNQKLSEERANAVKNTLVQMGMPHDIIVTYGRGELEPIASNESDEGKELNRRVEMIINPIDMQKLRGNVRQ
ncbi:MAG: OmpA family protein [Alphaproteobacteria bacterium]|nr:OmpA family protein [Alphaproteobacteria bacterium]